MKTSWLSYFENPKPSLTPEELDELEQHIGFALPHSLRELYGTLGGGRFRFGRFVDAADYYYDLHMLIAAKAANREDGFVAEYEYIVKKRELVPSHLVPFAIEGGGNFYCLDRGDESVWYADMELGNDGLLPPPKRIADSLDAFLRAGQPREE